MVVAWNMEYKEIKIVPHGKLTPLLLLYVLLSAMLSTHMYYAPVLLQTRGGSWRCWSAAEQEQDQEIAQDQGVTFKQERG